MQLTLALGARVQLLLLCLCHVKIVFICLLESRVEDVKLQNLSDKPVFKVSLLTASHSISSPCRLSHSGYY